MAKRSWSIQTLAKRLNDFAVERNLGETVTLEELRQEFKEASWDELTAAPVTKPKAATPVKAHK